MKEIQLTKGQVAFVDDEDYEFLMQWKWAAIKKGNNFYAGRGVWVSERKNNIIVYMHRILLGIPGINIEGDHADGNSLNNQKYNLRIATSSQNKANRPAHKDAYSKFLGVSWERRRNKWTAQICKNKKKTFIGYFQTEIDAALAYNKKAIEIHGQFAKINQVA